MGMTSEVWKVERMESKRTDSAFPLFLEKRCGVNEPKTVICFGTPRGGTSMVAGAIAGLGVFMGHDLPVNVEDPYFNPDVDKSLDFESFCARLPLIISDRNEKFQNWGWKFPVAIRYLEKIFPLLRNPHFVIVKRDPVPAVLRQNPTDNVGKINETRRRLRLELDNINLAAKLAAPTLVVSYERASHKPEEFLNVLSNFLQVDIPEDIKSIIEFMKPGEYKKPQF